MRLFNFTHDRIFLKNIKTFFCFLDLPQTIFRPALRFMWKTFGYNYQSSHWQIHKKVILDLLPTFISQKAPEKNTKGMFFSDAAEKRFRIVKNIIKLFFTISVLIYRIFKGFERCIFYICENSGRSIFHNSSVLFNGFFDFFPKSVAKKGQV